MVESMNTLLPSNMKTQSQKLEQAAKSMITSDPNERIEWGVRQYQFSGRWFTAEELAEWAGVVVGTIRNWRNKGFLESRMREKGLYR